MSQSPLFITGLSGAGMSSAMAALEDLGYDVFDNFPLSLVDALVHDPAASGKPIAIGVDTRSRAFDPAALIVKAQQLGGRIVFLTCDETILQKRFTETRRRHPMAQDRPVSAGIKKEQSLLHPLREVADPIIDTTELSIHDLKRVLEGYFKQAGDARLTVTLLSFGFKYGLPREADMVLDVRFLKNPHWEEDLRPYTGKDASVAAYIEQDNDLADFLHKTQSLLDTLLPRYAAEGKSYFTLAVGCTGGKHRSVYIAERLTTYAQQKGFGAVAEHRDMGR